MADNAEKVGNYLIKSYRELQEKYDIIGDVRGKGLMLAVEFVKDRKNKTPNKEATAQMMELSRERGILYGKTGVHGNVLRLQPPLCLSLDDAKYVIAAFEDSIKHVK